MPELYDPQLALTSDWRSFFVARRKDRFLLPCEDGAIELPGNWMLLNIMLTMPLIKRNIPINREKHLHLSGIFNTKVSSAIETRVVETLEAHGYTRREIGHDILMVKADGHNMCYTHLGPFIRTMDIFQIADTILQPEAKAKCTVDYGNIDDGDIIRMEAAFKEQSNDMFNLLIGDTLPINIFRPALLCGGLKDKQFHQFVLSAGPRTDTDDNLFRRPVVGSFLSGMRDIMDLAVESRSASKSTHYNKSQMSIVQYKNRKIHIQISMVEKLYPGDCGSTKYILRTPNKKTISKYLGIFYVGDNGQLTELTKARYEEVMHKPLLMRNPTTCRHTDGYCEVCGGTITKTFSPDGNVGFLANVKTGAPATQQVLSTKHLISTISIEYQIPEAFKRILIAFNNDIYLRPQMKSLQRTLAFGFPEKNLSKLGDLRYALPGRTNTSHFSDISNMHVGLLKEDGTIDKKTNRVSMSTIAKTNPHLSAEVIEVIRKHPEDVIVDDKLVWILLRNVNLNEPIMRCTVMNDSIKNFVDQFTSLVTTDVENYTSLPEYLEDLSSKVWERVDTHFTHISVLAKSSLITSQKDFSIPVVDDPENVMFGRNSRIIPMRSVGGLLAFEGYKAVTNKPITFITPKEEGPFDQFMGYTDIIERDRHWPVPSMLHKGDLSHTVT